KIDKLVMISVDTFSERDYLSELLEGSKNLLKGRQRLYERVRESGVPGDASVIQAKRSVEEMKSVVNQLQDTYDRLEGRGRNGLSIKADVYYTFDGVSDKKRVEVEMYEDEYDEVEQAGNVLLKKIHADKISGVD